jgi:DNA-binding PadR family transcriptional regulator
MFRLHHHHGPHEHARHGRHGFGWSAHGMRGGEGRHERGRRSGRVFEQGDLRLLLLKLVAEKPRHGYDLIKAIEDAVGGAYSPSPGTIYPTLTLLEELAYVTVTPSPEGAKKLHEITDQGRSFLEANRPTLRLLLAKMAEATRTHGGGPAPQLVRAMENLKLALRLRLDRGPLTPEQIDGVAAAIDAAATAVERV